MLGYCRVVVVQWSERRQLRSEALGSISSGYPSFFLQYVSILIYHQLLTNMQLLLPVVIIRIVTKIIMSIYKFTWYPCMYLYCSVSRSQVSRDLLDRM